MSQSRAFRIDGEWAVELRRPSGERQVIRFAPGSLDRSWLDEDLGYRCRLATQGDDLWCIEHLDPLASEKERKRKFDAFVAAGFTAAQALALVACK